MTEVTASTVLLRNHHWSSIYILLVINKSQTFLKYLKSAQWRKKLHVIKALQAKQYSDGNVCQSENLYFKNSFQQRGRHDAQACLKPSQHSRKQAGTGFADTALYLRENWFPKLQSYCLKNIYLKISPPEWQSLPGTNIQYQTASLIKLSMKY